MWLLQYSTTQNRCKTIGLQAQGLLRALAQLVWNDEAGNECSYSLHTPRGELRIEGLRASCVALAVDFPNNTCWVQWLWKLSMKVGRQGANDFLPELEIARSLIAEWAQRMDTWFGQASKAKPIRLVDRILHGKRRARRLPRALLALTSRKKRPRQAVAAWKEDGSDFTLSTETCMKKQCAMYVGSTRSALASARTLELAFDGSNYGGVKTECIVAYSPDVTVACVASSVNDVLPLGCSAYLPPQPHAELGWRSNNAGAPMTQADLDRFDKYGFKKDCRPKPIYTHLMKGMHTIGFTKFKDSLSCIH
jgi:hypothetical protein